MDHYFIDLLLEQVLRGNRIGHAFLTQAWNEMVTLFNVKFGSQYDKEILKNKYKNLRQLYNDAKILLDQDGFFWDETREMVTAEDHVWDSYTKTYPDAHSYEYRTVPSYHKLCVIFGKESSNGRCSHLAHNVVLSGEGPHLKIEEKGIQHDADINCSRTDWTPLMDRYLIDLMLKQVHKGHRFGNIFSEQAWTNIVSLFNDRLGSQYEKYVLRGRHRNLKKLYDGMKNLLDQREFSWDGTQQMVTTSDDIWDAYIKEHPDGVLFRRKSNPNYDDLCLIYGNSSFHGRCNRPDKCVDFSSNGRDIRLPQNDGFMTDGWTPPMDRYFIDLMLEQIRRGHMVNKQFNKEAWGYMLAKFNANFESQHRKDVLKIRFKTLRRQYNDMKSLVDLSGFAWDEMLQMITADEDIWDAYIKDHPGAQPYRNRTLPNYNDLFLIYGNAITNGSHVHSSQLFDVDNYVLGVNVGQWDNQSSAGSDTLVIDWTQPMDRYFIHLMLEQVLEGNKTGSTFNKQAWSLMISAFNGRFGLQCDKYVLEKRYVDLMKQYNDISNLLGKGHKWDETRQTVTVEDGVLKSYAKEHPGAAMDEGEVLENYRDLSIIFGKAIQDARFGYLGPEKAIVHEALDMRMGGILRGQHFPGRDHEVSNQRRKRQSATPLTSMCSRKVKKTRKGWLEAVDKIHSSIESIVDALQAIPNMDDELFLDACDLLEDEKKAKAFVRMDIAHRKNWLLRKLRP